MCLDFTTAAAQISDTVSPESYGTTIVLPDRLRTKTKLRPAGDECAPPFGSTPLPATAGSPDNKRPCGLGPRRPDSRCRPRLRVSSRSRWKNAGGASIHSGLAAPLSASPRGKPPPRRAAPPWEERLDSSSPDEILSPLPQVYCATAVMKLNSSFLSDRGAVAPLCHNLKY